MHRLIGTSVARGGRRPYGNKRSDPGLLIIQNDVANEYSPAVIVAAITSAAGTKDYPTEVCVRPPEGGLTKASVVLLNQIRTLDKRRLVERWGGLEPETMQWVDEALKISVGLIPL